MGPTDLMSEDATPSADRKLSILFPESAQHTAKEIDIQGVTGLILTGERQHGMQKYVSNCDAGWQNERFLNLTRLVISAQQQAEAPTLWVAHLIPDGRAGFNSALHERVFQFIVSQCSFGALSDPCTFHSHVGWNEPDCQILATFDFDTDILRLNIEHSTKWTIEISFVDIKRAFLMQPEIKEGVTTYNFYMYLSSVPSLWKMLPKERVIQIPGSAGADIGKCSFLKLDLKNAKENELATLLDKLDASEFGVWWTSPITVLPGQQFLVDANEPWPIQWLLSEGYRISDQLSFDDMKWLRKHKDVLYSALKGVITSEIIVDVMKELKAFLLNQGRTTVRRLTPKLPNNYTLVRKVVVTPTRVIFLTPQPLPMNRVIRKYKPENFIMVSFRDESLQPLDLQPSSAFRELVNRIEDFLSDGLEVEGRKYTFLGCSSSQLRTHSCWMYASDPDNEATVRQIHHWMGDLTDARSVPLYVSRLAQFFTSSIKTIDLSGENYKIVDTPDIEINGYCFTDGFGKISTNLAEEVAKESGLSSTCSVYQVLFGGYKGVLTIDPEMPEGEVHFRPSMKHFDSSDKFLEVVDYSRPQRAYLDQHIITLMSQQGIADDVFLRLQEEYFHCLLEMFTSHERALQELDDIEPLFDVKEIHTRGISVLSDPFFRLLLLVRYREKLNKLLEKTSIPLPLNKGRMLMGVVDETGQLKPGQVFIQYSNDIYNQDAKTTVVNGPVMITQTPCLHPGDLRVFQAVKCPELNHLFDCLVFPTQGDIPHFSEISRPDPENNLYWATWHPDLIIHKNQQPKEKLLDKREELQRMPTQEDVIEYLADFVRSSSVGDVAETHLAHANVSYNGIFSAECLELARLYDVAVDLNKPAYIEPRLKSRTYPHFMMKKNKPQQISKRILGKLFRDASRLVLTTNLHLDIAEELLKTDKTYIYKIKPEMGNIDIPDSYRRRAEQYYEDYAARVQSLLDTYEVKDESHLFGGLVNNIESNGQEGCHLLMQSEINQLKVDYTEIFESEDVSVGLPTKALTWFNLAYKKGSLRSFAWIASPVLASVVETTGMQLTCGIKKRCEASNLDDEINHILELQQTAAEDFLKQIRNALPSLQCLLKTIDLAGWHIPSRDIFVHITHSDRNIMEREFAQICSVLPNMNLTQGNVDSDFTYEVERCYITKERIAMPLRYDGQEFIVHVYLEEDISEVLSNIASSVTDVLLRRCLQIMSQYWTLHCRRSLRKHISVIDICRLVLYCVKKDEDANLFDVLQKMFRILTENGDPKIRDLLNLPTEYFRQFQLNLFEGMQTLVISGMCFLLNHELYRFQNRSIRKMIAISTSTSRCLLTQNPSNNLVIYGCTIQIRRVHVEESEVCLAEVFGNKEQLGKLIHHIQHLEYPFEMKLGKVSFQCSNREPIFEASNTGNDRIKIIPYNKCSYLPNKFKKLALIVQPLSNEMNEARNLEKVVDQYSAIINRTRVLYDEQYHGQLRLVCRFTNFHFSANTWIGDHTVDGFVKLLNTKPRPIFTCNYPANVKSDTLDSLLQSKGFVKDKTPVYKNVVQFVTYTNTNEQETFDVVLDTDLRITEFCHHKFCFGKVELVRGMRRPDLYFKLEALLHPPDWNSVPYSRVTKSEVPLLVIDRRRPVDNMPFLRVHENFSENVMFVVQKKTTKYRYRRSEVTHRPDHFTAHVEVHISDVREYDFRKRKLNDFTKAVIFLPTLPPLCHGNVHRDLMKKMLDLATAMGNSLH